MSVDLIDLVGHNPIHLGAMSKYSNCYKCVNMSLEVGEANFYNEFAIVWNEIQILETTKSQFPDLK